MLLAVGAVHHHLIRVGMRAARRPGRRDGRSLGHPPLRRVDRLRRQRDPPLAGAGHGGDAARRARGDGADRSRRRWLKYRSAVEAGLLKICSKMGISTVSSYRGGQIFEAVGLDRRWWTAPSPGTPCRSAASGCASSASRRAAPPRGGLRIDAPKLPDHGFVRFRGDGEHHGFAPVVVKALHRRRAERRVQRLPEYLRVDAQPRAGRAARPDGASGRGHAVPLDEVEPVESIRQRFVTHGDVARRARPRRMQTLALGDEPDGRAQQQRRRRRGPGLVRRPRTA